jgi:hypothetical protein
MVPTNGKGCRFDHEPIGRLIAMQNVGHESRGSPLAPW